MNFGSTTPIAVLMKGPDLDVCRDYAEKVKAEMAKIPYLRDLQYGQPLNYPTVDIKINRELAGQFNLTPRADRQFSCSCHFVKQIHSAELLDG